jgi:hypothetical protein
MYSSRAALNCGAILVFKTELHKDAGLNTLLEAPETIEDELQASGRAPIPLAGSRELLAVPAFSSIESVFTMKESEGVRDLFQDPLPLEPTL